MAGGIFYREPRNPHDVHGPFTIDQLRTLVREGKLRPTDQVSVDGHAWLLATELEPELFPASAPDWFVAQPAWKRTANQVARKLQAYALVAWNHIKVVAKFYWENRKELRQLATEYLSFLKEPGNRREIRVSAADQNEAIAFDGDQWKADLPDCCIVCGEPADCDWNSEQRAVPDLTWPLMGPFVGLLIGVVGWILLWNRDGRWLIPLGFFLGFLLGYARRGETIVAVRFRRCREHLNRTRLPSLRTFHKTLIVGVGDRKVWRRFYYGERDLETPMAVPPDLSTIVQSTTSESDTSDPRPSYPTIRLAGDDETDADPDHSRSKF